MRRKNSMNLDNGQDVDRHYLIRDFKLLIIFLKPWVLLIYGILIFFFIEWARTISFCKKPE